LGDLLDADDDGDDDEKDAAETDDIEEMPLGE
jgi:hypothetical protein